MTSPNHQLGLLLVTCSAMAWSTTGFFTRLIPLDAWTLLTWRGLFGALGMLAVIVATERRGTWRSFRTMGQPSWLFASVSAVGMILFITALRYTTVAHVAVIYATAPFMAACFGGIAMGERPSRSAVVASLAALLGVAVMVGLGTEGGFFGDVLAFACTACMAAMIVIARRSRSISVMPAACLSALLSGLVCWPLGDAGALGGHDLILLALFGLSNSAIGLTLFTLGARHIPAIETALIGALDAPLAPFWVWLAFGETPRLGTIVGGTIVLGAVGAHIALSAPKARSEQPLPQP